MQSEKVKQPSILQSFLPILTLIALLFCSVKFFGDSASSGPNQIALILCAGVGILIGLYNGLTWKQLEEAMVHGISLSMGALFILLVVGALIGTWIMAGIVPTMIYYGLHIMQPSFFYVAACLVCALISLATGSSWTTASTVGIALIGIAHAMNLNLGMAAGAIISGAYFGDKMSPLSDTTNLAPAMAGTDLFTHIRHMAWSTIPSLLIACILFAVLGYTGKSADVGDSLGPITQALEANFDLSWYMMIPPLLVLFMVMKKVPAFPALLIGALLGGVFAMLFQPTTVLRFVGEAEGLSEGARLLKGFWQALASGYSSSTGNEALDKLLSRGGMGSMLNTVWLILSAMMFGAVMEKTLILERLASQILRFATGTGSLIAATLATSFGMNVIASDQYIAIVLPGRMYRAEFARRRLHPKNLSRCLEDCGTLTSPLVPWNTCGAYMSNCLGVATFAYLPFCFFNLINPLVSLIYGFTGFTIDKLPEGEEVPV